MKTQSDRKFYDLEPCDGSHYLLENGKPIARFDSLEKAEAVRASFVEELVEMYDRRADEVEKAGLGESPHEKRDAIRFGPRIAPEVTKPAANTISARSVAENGAAASQEGLRHADL
jgi:hypothetical protein